MISEWLNEKNWLQGMSARDIYGDETNRDDPNAADYDVYSAIKIEYPKKDIEQVLTRFKVLYKMVYPEKYEASVETFTTGQKFYPAHKLNDALDNFEQLERLFELGDI